MKIDIKAEENAKYLNEAFDQVLGASLSLAGVKFNDKRETAKLEQINEALYNVSNLLSKLGANVQLL